MAARHTQISVDHSGESAPGADHAKFQRDAFIASLAHELRNPLAAMRYAVDILYHEELDQRSIARARGALDRQLEHIVRLVDDLLEASRVSSGRTTLRREILDFGQIVRDSLQMTAPQLEHAGHHVVLDVPASPVLVDGDPARLIQIVVNLLSNACEHTPASGHVTVSLAIEGDQAVLRVRDDGVGIDGAALPTLFEMFAPVDRTQPRPHGGFGVGLAISRQLVEDHCGTIVARSGGLGRGSEFEVRLALSAGHHPFAGDSLTRAPIPRARPLRVVVADDNEDAAAGLELVLSARGHEVFLAYDGVDAIDLADRVKPDAIILDIGMPRLSGLEVCRAIRSKPWAQSAVMVAVTGWGQAEDLRRSFDAGFDHHIVKPCDGKSLSDLLERGRC